MAAFTAVPTRAKTVDALVNHADARASNNDVSERVSARVEVHNYRDGDLSKAPVAKIGTYGHGKWQLRFESIPLDSQLINVVTALQSDHSAAVYSNTPSLQ